MLSNIPLPILILFFFSGLVALYFISRITIQTLFDILRRIFKHEYIVFVLISALFFPGTVIHELSHFLMATILFLRVIEMKLFPSHEGKYIKLGHVIYEKKDFIRGILVGIAPLIVGIFFFWWLYTINILQIGGSWYLQVLKIYAVFVVSTTMFSSKQDLIDLVYVIPLAIIFAFIVYIFQINIFFFLANPKIVAVLHDFMYSVTVYVFISLCIHIALIGIIRLLLLNKKYG